MYRNLVSYQPAPGEELPDRCRPLLRYRREIFGYLAAFPNGRVVMLGDEAGSLLARGASFAEFEPYLLTALTIPVDFHFSAPLMAWVELTRRCNLRCPHCFVEAGTARATELTTDQILRLLDEWAEMGVFSVVLTGGEPTIHPDFVAILRHAHDLGFCVGLATNGMPLTQRLLEQLPCDDVLISVSIDELHSQGTAKGKSDFEYAAQRLLEIGRFGFNTSIMTTTTSENAGELQAIIDWAVENDVSLRSVPFVAMGRGAQYRHLVNSTADVELAARFWIAEEEWERVRDRKLGLCAGKVFNFLLTMVFATHRCMSGRGICYVTSAGDVFPCSTCSGTKVLCGGSLQMSSFREVWEGEWDIRQITWDDYRSTCSGCPVDDERYFCTGRCPGSSSVLSGRLDSCGTTEFQRLSILRREELFRERVQSEPRVAVQSPRSSD